ncbi:MAG: hypothetical protein J7M26_05295 [Armatimonadetes bacterium]|nr:hypothetical protein [Armatimonadota bacterium]
MVSVTELLHKLFVPCEPKEDAEGAPALLLTVECQECGEFVRTRIDKANDLQTIYGSDDRPVGYLLTKELIGANCRNMIHVRMKFDAHQRPTDVEVEGGHLVHLECCE